MNKHLPYNDPDSEAQRFSKRSIICALLILVLFLCVLARLIFLQIIEHHFYATLSQKNIISISPIKPSRGLIYDRNGILVAKNIPVYSIMLIPGRIKSIDETLKSIAPIINLTQDDIDSFKQSLKNSRRFQLVSLKDDLTEQELDQFYVNQYRFPGLIVKKSLMREYPLKKVMSNVIGYVGRINASELSKLPGSNYTASDYVGKRGIELEYESLLHGKTGAEVAETNAAGKTVRILKERPPTAGQSIYLTIDSKLQAFAEKQLANKDGAIVAIQPNTGEVLALVTHPTYDPNPFVTGISSKAYKALLDDPDHPLVNRAIRGLYAPGSTVKPFISAYALNAGVITPKTTIQDPGWFRVPHTKHIFHDWKHDGHGWVNDYKAIVVSCDTFFYTLAEKLGVKRLDDALTSFGFGSKTGIDLPAERKGNVPTPLWKRAYRGKSWYTGDTIQSGIGQGYELATPLQLAYATAILAEHGKKMPPHLLLNKTLPHITPLNYSNPNSWDVPIAGMNGVIMSPLGTAWIFGKDAPYTVAAKTGTAQVFGHSRNEELTRKNIPKKLRNNHLFIVFAPIDHPKIALAVVVEHDAFADLIARKVLDFYFKELKNAHKTHQ